MPRLEIDAPVETIEALRQLSADNDSPVIEIFPRIIARYALLDRAAQEGKGLQITDSTWKVKKHDKIIVQADRKYFRLTTDRAHLLMIRTRSNHVIDLESEQNPT